MSRFISLILRHHPEKIGIELDRHGWADVHELLDGMNRYSRFNITFPILKEIVKNDEKQRYSFNGDMTRIRANQGHSIPVEIEMKAVRPPAVLYHGTGEKSVSSILKEGILPMNRLYVHLSTDVRTAQKVGARHGRPFVFAIDASGMYADGIPFYLSPNGIWLVKKVPAAYLKKK